MFFNQYLNVVGRLVGLSTHYRPMRRADVQQRQYITCGMSPQDNGVKINSQIYRYHDQLPETC